MMVRAKFWVSELRKTSNGQEGGVYGFVTLAPAYGKGNEAWSKATPSGKIEMTITNEDAVDQFEVGKAYFVNFEPAEA